MYLVLIETSGNQSYIFCTNKLRENIGASELTYRAGTQWVMEAVAAINTGQTPEYSSETSFRHMLLDPNLNQPIDNAKIEVIIATSGKALLLANDREDAKQVIQSVTKKALQAASGLDICGIISDKFDLETGDLGKMNQQLHQQFEGVRGARPGPDTRFLRLPVVAECATSGLPAAVCQDQNGRAVLRSKVSEQKRSSRDAGFNRIQSLLKSRNDRYEFLGNISQFEDDFADNISWLSVVHADGNGLGQIFLDFGKDIDIDCGSINRNRYYIDQYRQFSIAIDICTEQAFLDAIESVFVGTQQPEGTAPIIIPLVPLILGGDDLTVVCDGRYALQFTQQFLTKFEYHTQNPVMLPVVGASRIIIDRANKHLSADRLSACAGITVMKKHFPFSVAYSLAEELIKSAKTVKDIIKEDGKTIPCSAIDYHILYDSSGVDLKSIRAKLEIANPLTRLYCRPYVVSEPSWYPESYQEWIDRHHWTKLTDRVDALTKKDIDRVDALRAKDDEDRYLLPNSQMHDLRESLFLGRDGADARYQLIRNRYLDRKIDKLEGESNSLFWSELKKPQESNSGQIYTTGLLDAMDAASFWEGRQ
jgi:hypothetical protein